MFSYCLDIFNIHYSISFSERPLWRGEKKKKLFEEKKRPPTSLCRRNHVKGTTWKRKMMYRSPQCPQGWLWRDWTWGIIYMTNVDPKRGAKDEFGLDWNKFNVPSHDGLWLPIACHPSSTFSLFTNPSAPFFFLPPFPFPTWTHEKVNPSEE